MSLQPFLGTPNHGGRVLWPERQQDERNDDQGELDDGKEEYRHDPRVGGRLVTHQKMQCGEVDRTGKAEYRTNHDGQPKTGWRRARCIQLLLSAEPRSGAGFGFLRKRLVTSNIPTASKRSPRAKSAAGLSEPWVLTRSVLTTRTSTRPINTAMPTPPSRTHQSMARGRRFTSTARSTASRLGLTAAVKAKAKNPPVIAAPASTR